MIRRALDALLVVLFPTRSSRSSASAGYGRVRRFGARAAAAGELVVGLWLVWTARSMWAASGTPDDRPWVPVALAAMVGVACVALAVRTFRAASRDSAGHTG